MPNWCEYGVAIYGSPEAIGALDTAITLPEANNSDQTHDFTLVHPVPEDLDILAGYMAADQPGYQEWMDKQYDNLDKHGHANWYSWCVDNWGTKWPPTVHNYFVVHHPGGKSEIHANGESAWGPPSELMARITAEYPVTIVITYKEDGMGFAGAEAFHGGVPIYEDSFRYDDIEALVDLDKKMASLDIGDDEWMEAQEDAQDAIYVEIDRREGEAYRKANSTLAVC